MFGVLEEHIAFEHDMKSDAIGLMNALTKPFPTPVAKCQPVVHATATNPSLEDEEKALAVLDICRRQVLNGSAYIMASPVALLYT